MCFAGCQEILQQISQSTCIHLFNSPCQAEVNECFAATTFDQFKLIDNLSKRLNRK